ncbi:MAG: UDP-2,4-diacetamido-2,4,6-trideoxy-beta-L-altropyranose hydrolase [Ignavibacteriales bacterium]|nr:UDP-2,4-diacetamido-2,4,6-trideoxy-beta-L-altropyranose hydrolase [Ignavibacteriales bacterium]
MKVHLLTEGSTKIGFGHITRCLSLSEVFEMRGVSPSFKIIGDDSVRTLLNGKDYHFCNWIDELNLGLLSFDTDDVVIVDSYLAPQQCYERITQQTSIPVFIDDNMRIDYPSSIVVNGTIFADEFRYPVKTGVKYLLGSRFLPLRNAFWNIEPRTASDEVNSVLITFGGDDPRNLTPRILRLLCTDYPSLIKNVVIGDGFQNVPEIESAKDRNTNLHVSLSGEGMRDVMLSTDVAISAAGQTLYELACSGIPTVAVLVAQNQKNNIEGWQRTGFIENAGSWENVKLEEEVLKSLKTILPVSVRKDKSITGRSYVDGRGALRVVDEIFSRISFASSKRFSIRKATFDDCKTIFDLSNEEYVRKNSIHQNPISWNEHIQWFHNRLNDLNYELWVILAEDNSFIGQVKFQIHANRAVVSISLVARFRGRGYSSRILEKASSKLFAERSNINTIDAYIKPNNIPSVKSFERNGFSFLNEVTIENDIFHLYCKTQDSLSKN